MESTKSAHFGAFYRRFHHVSIQKILKCFHKIFPNIPTIRRSWDHWRRIWWFWILVNLLDLRPLWYHHWLESAHHWIPTKLLKLQPHKHPGYVSIWRDSIWFPCFLNERFLHFQRVLPTWHIQSAVYSVDQSTIELDVEKLSCWSIFHWQLDGLCWDTAIHSLWFVFCLLFSDSVLVWKKRHHSLISVKLGNSMSPNQSQTSWISLIHLQWAVGSWCDDGN